MFYTVSESVSSSKSFLVVQKAGKMRLVQKFCSKQLEVKATCQAQIQTHFYRVYWLHHQMHFSDPDTSSGQCIRVVYLSSLPSAGM